MLAIIDYGSGNIRSVAKAFEYVAGDKTILVTSDAKEVARAERIVLPGVGAFGDCMRGLQALEGMIPTLNEQVHVKKIPFLGICVGMQMMFERGLEHGTHAGLGWLSGEIVPLAAPGLKIPHMGWNALSIKKHHPIVAGIGDGDHAYFVHSFHADAQSADLIASVDYGMQVAAVVGRDHMVGTQFHPEKSQKSGLAILSNFLKM